MFKTVNSGDTMKLVGTFGLTRLQWRSFTKTLTIDATYASFTDTLDLAHLDNVKVVGGKWDIRGGSSYGRAVAVFAGSNIWLDKTNVTGVDGEQGVGFVGTTNAKISNGVFTGLRVAIGISGVTGGLATHNKITHAASDGIDIADSHGVTASYNSCSLGNPSAGVHPDCIQLWSTAGHPIQSYNVVTRNSATGMTQGFTSFSTGGGASHVEISYNTVNTSMSQGVACYDCWDSKISYNTLTTANDAVHLTNLNIIGGGRNTVVGNIINPAPFLKKDPSWTDAEPLSEDLLTFDPNFRPADDIGGIGDLVASGSAAAVPEPASWALLIAGFAMTGVMRRRVRTVAA